VRPLFSVLVGDPFLCEEKRKEIITSLEKEFGSGLPITLRTVGDFSLESLLAEARTLPFLSSAQLFSIRRADQLKKGDVELLESYFKSPHPQSIFVFETDSLEKGHPLLQWGERAKQIVRLEPQAGRLTADFIRRKLKESGKKITEEALRLLEARLGDAFLFLDTLLDQLIFYSGEKGEIDRNAVEALEERLARFEGEDLMEALAVRNVSKALEILNDLLEGSSRDTPALIGLLHWQLRRFWEAKRELEKGCSEREVASRLRLWPARTPAFFQSLRRFSRRELERILEGLFELDWRLKTGRTEGRYEIESWLVSAIG
jgi:DNA polymerase-3 subunit delta